jgi:hypothetical protein
MDQQNCDEQRQQKRSCRASPAAERKADTAIETLLPYATHGWTDAPACCPKYIYTHEYFQNEQGAPMPLHLPANAPTMLPTWGQTKIKASIPCTGFEASGNDDDEDFVTMRPI